MPQGASDRSGYGTSPDIPGAHPDGYFLPRSFPCPSIFFYPDVIINSLSFYLGCKADISLEMDCIVV
jgi:hypothetical protein